MVKEFNNLEEIQKYYNEESTAYIFKEDNEYLDLIIFNFSLDIKCNIKCRNIAGIDITACDINAWDIKARNINAYGINARDIKANNINAYNINADYISARDINAWNINAYNINARDINAYNINYFAVCFTYKNIKYSSIKGPRENSRHFVLDGNIEIKED